ncbi:transporter substrate-binding domain-containing protein [Roseateles asaccharophilus]|uniref:Polar amino acid transport system substrate-binding protein n=1 Tax=Roseateles asaccharophilus TaxID=582607 RepID=A0ABU2AHM3_9BURK|nr:transporter substrate-binding domain-containing protein [Roseateles asaccharophilus]MDR7335478.1 polar amino acid transport system substrate-binding protein [Roseateles asaccharophilus]
MSNRRLAASLLTMLLAAAAPARADEIVLASPSYWCPFSCRAGAAQEGFTVDIVREIFGAAGHRVRLVNQNYSRALLDVRAGTYTATPSTFRSEAPDFVFPEQPISRNRYCVFTRRDSAWRYRGPASLDELDLVGVIRDYSYGAALDTAIKATPRRFEVHTGDSLTERMLRRLKLGRMAAFIEEESLVAYTVKLHPELAARSAGCEAPSYAYLALSPRHPQAQDYARTFSEGMLKLRRSGRLKAILAGYGLTEWPAP